MSVTLHCEAGDIKIELFCEQCPKTCENFLALCASDYYNGCIFHRNIKGFMTQTGDPTGKGKGGESIWGGKVNTVRCIYQDCKKIIFFEKSLLILASQKFYQFVEFFGGNCLELLDLESYFFPWFFQ